MAQREFLLSHLIQCRSAATGMMTGMGTCWQYDKNATTGPTTSHQNAIDVALLDALHALSDETSKAGTHYDPSTDEAYQGSSTRNSGRPLSSTQARESVDTEISSPQIVNGSVDEELLCPGLSCVSHGSFTLIDLRGTHQINSKEKKPPYRYATLIAMAIPRANNHCLPLTQIYQWISNHFPYHSLTDSGWQNSIRHNLSLNKNFIKTKRPSHDIGKGHYWGATARTFVGSKNGTSNLSAILLRWPCVLGLHFMFEEVRNLPCHDRHLRHHLDVGRRPFDGGASRVTDRTIV